MSNSNGSPAGEYITVSRLGSSTTILSRSALTGKTISQLKQQLIDGNHMNSNEFLSISTPCYRMVLSNDYKPVDAFPQLALAQRPKKYELPDFYIAIVKKNEEDKIVFNVNSKITNGDEVPFWEFFIDKKEMDNSKDNADKLIELMNEQFPYDHDKTDVNLELDGNNVEGSQKLSEILCNMKNTRYTFRTALTESAKKMISLRSQIVREVISTENTYIEGLREMKNWWHQQLCKPPRILSDEEAGNIFRDIPNILSCHENFYNEIQAKGDSICATLSDVFLNFSAYFKVSNLYISNYSSYIEIITEKSKTQWIADRLKELQFSTPSKSNRDITSYLITPVQRMPRYILFIRELIKHTPNGHPDKRMLEYAAETVQSVTQQIDEATQKSENMAKLISIQRKLTNKFELITPSRIYEKEAKVTIFTKNYNNCPGTFYLFNDILFLTSIERKGETYIYAKEIGEFRYFDRIPTSNSIMFIKTISKVLFSSKTQEITVTFNDPNDKNEFLNIIGHYQIEKYSSEQQDRTILFQNYSLECKYPPTYLCDFVTVNQFAYSFGGKNTNNSATAITGIYKKMPKCADCFISSEIGERYGHTLTVVDNKIYLFGGTNGSDYFNDLWSFDTTSNRKCWEKEESYDPPEPRTGHTTVYYDRKLFVFGGCNKKKQILNDLIVYDIDSGRWKPPLINQPQQPEGRKYHSATVFDSIMLIFGGKNKVALNDIALFDMNNLIWLSKPQLSISKGNEGKTEIEPRYGHKAIFYKGWIIVIGGKITNTSSSNDNSSKEQNDFVFKRQNALGFNIYDFSKSNYQDPIETYILYTGGNDPSSLIHFGFGYDKDPNIFIYGGKVIESRIPTYSMFSILPPPIIASQFHEEYFEKSKSKSKFEDTYKSLSSTTTIETKPIEKKSSQETPVHNPKPIIKPSFASNCKTIGPNTTHKNAFKELSKPPSPPSSEKPLPSSTSQPKEVPPELLSVIDELGINITDVRNLSQMMFKSFLRQLRTFSALRSQNAYLTQKVADQKTKTVSEQEKNPSDIFIKLKDKRSNRIHLTKVSELSLPALEAAAASVLLRHPTRLQIGATTVTADNCQALIERCNSLTPTVTVLS